MSAFVHTQLPQGYELPDNTPVTEPLLQVYLQHLYPTLAAQAAVVKSRLDEAMLGSLRDIRSAGKRTWADIKPTIIGEALTKIFMQQDRQAMASDDTSYTTPKDLSNVVKEAIAEATSIRKDEVLQDDINKILGFLASKGVMKLEVMSDMYPNDLAEAISSPDFTPVLRSKLRNKLGYYIKQAPGSGSGSASSESTGTISYISNAHNFLYTYGSHWKYQISDEVLQKLAASLPQHYQHWKASHTDKLLHPLYLIFSGPGTGKSRLLEEFNQLCILAVAEDHELHAFLKDNCLILKISFENGTPYSSAKARDASLELGLRVAYTFQGQKTTSFEEFCDNTLHEGFRIGSVVGRLIESTGKKQKEVACLFLVDGIQMLSGQILKDVIILLSGLVNNAPYFAIVAIAGTYLTPVDAVLHASPQQRVYLTPPPVHAQAIVNSNGDQTLQLLINDVDGHGRAIEVVAEKLDKGGELGELEVFMAALRVHLEEKYPALKRPPSCILKAVCAAMTGMVVDLKTKLGDSAVEDILQIGLFSLKQVAGGFLLHCPYILLWLFAKHSNILELQQMDFCTYEEQKGSLGKNQWQHWQHFINLFHVVKSHMFEPGQYPVSKFHHGARLSSDLADLTIFRHPLQLICASNQLSTKSEMYNYATTMKHEMGEARVQDCSNFIENAPSANAGDSFGAVLLADSTVIHEIFQAKHTPTRATTSSDFLEEWHKAAATNKDIFMLFTTGLALNEFMLPRRCGIVTKDQFTTYFGIFAGRAFASAKVNINQATRKQLEQIPFIGKAKIEQILSLRPFKNQADYETRMQVTSRFKRTCDWLYFDTLL